VVRIISGECKGRRLKTLKGSTVRPTSDRAKETLFNLLTDRVPGCRFLDLFSGTGSIGLEAASRGAEQVLLVESNAAVLKLLDENVEHCHVSDRVTIHKGDARESLRLFSLQEQTFDLVFLDPPYNDHSAYGLIQEIGERGLLNEDGWVIVEHDRHHKLPDAYGKLLRVRSRRVGDTVFSFYGGNIEG
jgi:16S rRNA (guanine(966)-N(2))-methyltransferase RsmD